MAKIKILSILSFFVFIMISCGSDDTNPPSSEVVYAGGTPDEPAEVILNSPHEISKNVFYNYFKYEGVKGERIIINALLTT